MASNPPAPIEFEAGKMTFDAATKKVTADPRRGKVRVHINADGEKHFEWRDYLTNNMEHDLYVFEGDAKFDKVNKGPGRVYYLHFESYEEKYFFWLQEKDAAKDEELCKKINALINYSLDAMEAEPAPIQPTQVTQPTTGIQNQSRPAVSNLGQASMGQNPSPADFQRMFSEAMKTIQQHGVRKPTPSLNEILTPQFLETVLQDKEYQDALQQHLPETQQTPEGLRASIKSAQLQQAIDALDEALNSEEGMTVLMSLGFDPNAFTQARDGTEAFLIALEKWAKEHGNK